MIFDKFDNEKKIELLAPAGSPEALNAAIGEGADAVYLGLQDFNARARAKNFTYKQFESAVNKLHSMDKKIYVTMNTVFEEREASMVYNLLKYLSAIRPDGIIVQDVGILNMASRDFPDLPIHASTQMNISSFEGVNSLSKFNVKRVVLSRELDLEQIKDIRRSTTTELEIFVHGALCVSLSGACLFSSYFGGKSANRGRCTQACRRLYENGDNFKEKKYYFSLNDLSLLKYVPELIESGINSLKLEGRMKSYQYISTVVKAYRLMIDEYKSDRESAFIRANEILKCDFARKKTDFLFINRDNKNIVSGDRSGQTGIYQGKIISTESDENGVVLVLDRDTDISKGDTVRIQAFDDSKRVSVRVISGLTDRSFLIKSNDDFVPSKNDEVFIVNKQEYDRSYPSVIENNINKYKKHPGIMPPPKHEKIAYKKIFKLPDGYYVKINKSSDIYILQTERPEKVIFHVNRFNQDELFSNLGKTQFNPGDFILYLEPYFDMNEQEYLKGSIEKFIEKGFNVFMINNYGQYNILKRYDVNLICGPFLYTFNSYSVYFINNLGIKHIVSPIENSKKNLYLTKDNSKNAEFFITIFSYPELFQIISRFDSIYTEKVIKDSQNNYDFFMNYGKDKTSVLPQNPFCITDKVIDLKKKGFNKFIIDLAFTKLNKSLYKQIMRYAKTSIHMEKTSRFNWKDGFYFDKSEPSSNKTSD